MRHRDKLPWLKPGITSERLVELEAERAPGAKWVDEHKDGKAYTWTKGRHATG